MKTTRRLIAQAISLTFHGLFLLAVLFVVNRASTSDIPVAPLPDVPNKLIYVATPGLAMGKGGGGSRTPAPPKPAEIPPPRPMTIIPVVSAAPADPPPALSAPVMTSADALLSASGVTGTVAVPRGGDGDGTGIGPGKGPGVGPGEGPGFGGTGEAGVGGVEMPVRIREVKPQYTPEAMRARVQGSVVMQAIVDVTGRVTNVRVIKSLDRVFGLDEEAKRAAYATPFKPCKKDGQPVACVITFELQFTLR